MGRDGCLGEQPKERCSGVCNGHYFGKGAKKSTEERLSRVAKRPELWSIGLHQGKCAMGNGRIHVLVCEMHCGKGDRYLSGVGE